MTDVITLLVNPVAVAKVLSMSVVLPGCDAVFVPHVTFRELSARTVASRTIPLLYKVSTNVPVLKSSS
ncbi:hypothetical protein DSECCO2_488050 [anaerobic digester metagenome]